MAGGFFQGSRVLIRYYISLTRISVVLSLACNIRCQVTGGSLTTGRYRRLTPRLLAVSTTTPLVLIDIETDVGESVRKSGVNPPCGLTLGLWLRPEFRIPTAE